MGNRTLTRDWTFKYKEPETEAEKLALKRYFKKHHDAMIERARKAGWECQGSKVNNWTQTSQPGEMTFQAEPPRRGEYSPPAVQDELIAEEAARKEAQRIAEALEVKKAQERKIAQNEEMLEVLRGKV